MTAEYGPPRGQPPRRKRHPEVVPLKAPRFGNLPEPGQHTRPTVRSKWHEPMEIVRQHPGQWAMVAYFKGGGTVPPKEMLTRAYSAKSALLGYLERRRRLEFWEVRLRCVPGTWNDRAMYVRFVREWTEAEREAHRAPASVRSKRWREEAKKRKAAEEAEHHLAEMRAAQRLEREAGA